MKKIKFSENWNNKLGCIYFTTARLSTPSKLEYYNSEIGNQFEVVLKGETHSIVTLRTVVTMKINELNHHFTHLDAGMKFTEFIDLMTKMYNKKPEWKGLETKLIVLLFKKT